MENSTIKTWETEKYANFSKTWWKPDGPVKAIFSFNAVRIPFITTIVEKKIGNKLRFLDVGCGGGILSEGLAKALLEGGHSSSNIEIVGLDPVKELIAVAVDHLPENFKEVVTYVEGTVEEYSASLDNNDANSKFDIIVVSEVLDHVQNPDILMKWAMSLLKVGGSIIVTGPAKTALAWIGAVLIAEYIIRLIPIGTHYYENFVALNAIKEMMKQGGCRVTKDVGVVYNPLFNKWYTISWFKSLVFMVAAEKEN